jgi:hypothetical protein
LTTEGKEADFAYFARVVWSTRLGLDDEPSLEVRLAALKKLDEQRRQLDLRAPVRASGPPLEGSDDVA